MTVLGAAIRTWAESLILGSSGTTKTMASGRFKPAGMQSRDNTEHHVAERAVAVIVGIGRASVPINQFDGFAFKSHPVAVRVTYARTNAGGEMAESLNGEQNGSGEIDEIEARANADALDIETVLRWHENAMVSPAMVNISEGEYTIDRDTSAEVVTLTCLFGVEVIETISTVGTYAT